MSRNFAITLAATQVAVVLLLIVLVLQGGDDEQSTYIAPTVEREPIVIQVAPTKDCGSGVYGAMCRIGKVPPLDPVE